MPRYKTLIPEMPKTDELIPYLRRIDEAKWYSNFGRLETELRERLERQFDAHVVTFSSATAGLECALLALMGDVGGEVTCPALSFVATATAINRAGFNPRYIDVDPLTWAVGINQVFNIITDAFIPVCPFGADIDVEFWSAFQNSQRRPVIIDAAAAYGNIRNRGGFHVPAVFSLHATKSLGAGEGGFLVTSDEALARELRDQTNFGLDAQRVARVPWGTNAKLSEYHAAVALASLDAFPRTSDRRREVAYMYHSILHDDLNIDYQDRPADDVLVSYQVLIPSRCDVVRVAGKMADAGIETRRWYWPALNSHPALRSCDLDALPNTIMIGDRLIGLPFYCDLTLSDVEYICDNLLGAIR